jgi:hypothetical protein
MHELLRGELNSPVEITLARAQGQGKHYTVRVLRHRFRAFDEQLALDQAEREQPKTPQKDHALWPGSSPEPALLSPVRLQLADPIKCDDSALNFVFLVDVAGSSLADPVYRRCEKGDPICARATMRANVAHQ